MLDRIEENDNVLDMFIKLKIHSDAPPDVLDTFLGHEICLDTFPCHG